MADPGRHTRAYHFSLSLFTSFSLFWVLQNLAQIPPFRYSPGTHLSDTRPDLTFSVLARIPPSRYSPGSHISGTRPDSPFLVLARISTFPVLTRIPPFWYSPGPFSGTRPDPTFFSTHPDPTFPVLARIPPFRGFTLGVVHLHTLSWTFTSGCICLTKNIGLSPKGVCRPSILLLNTCIYPMGVTLPIVLI